MALQTIPRAARWFAMTAIVAALTAGAAAQPEAASQPAAPAPASAPASGGAAPQAMEIIINGVEGNVQVRMAEDKPWEAAKIGMKLDQGAEFRTGPRSAVRFIIPPDQTVTLDRLGTVKVIRAVQDAKKIKTDLGMKYGRTRYDIESAGLEHESNIRGPGTTLAVRGTKVSLYDQPPFEPEARSLTGRAAFTNTKKQTIAFGSKGTQAQVGDQSSGPADEQSLLATDKPVSLQDNDDRRRLLFIQTRNRAKNIRSINDFIDAFASFVAVQSTMPHISLETNIARAVPGLLAFDLHWLGASNLNLFLTTPQGERLASYPFFVNAKGKLASLGATPLLLTSGRIDPGPFTAYSKNLPTDGTGRETAYWTTNKFPAGKYVVGASLLQGEATSLSIGVYQNGSLIQTLTGNVSPSMPTVKFNVQVTK